MIDAPDNNDAVGVFAAIAVANESLKTAMVSFRTRSAWSLRESSSAAGAIFKSKEMLVIGLLLDRRLEPPVK